MRKIITAIAIITLAAFGFTYTGAAKKVVTLADRFLKMSDTTATVETKYAANRDYNILAKANTFTAGNTFNQYTAFGNGVQIGGTFVLGSNGDAANLSITGRNGVKITSYNGPGGEIATFNNVNPTADNPGIQFQQPFFLSTQNTSEADTVANNFFLVTSTPYSGTNNIVTKVPENLFVRFTGAVPASSSATGKENQIAMDTNFLYWYSGGRWNRTPRDASF